MTLGQLVLLSLLPSDSTWNERNNDVGAESYKRGEHIWLKLCQILCLWLFVLVTRSTYYNDIINLTQYILI